MSIDRQFRVVEIKRRIRRSHFKVNFIKGANRTNVPPIAVIMKAINFVRMNRLRNDIDAKIIIAGMIGKQINQYLSLEHINSHGSLEGTLRIIAADEAILRFLI